MEFIQILFPILGISNFVYMYRRKISEILGRSETGKWFMSPIMIPYVIYGLIKLSRDEDFIMRILDAKKQRKIIDYF